MDFFQTGLDPPPLEYGLFENGFWKKKKKFFFFFFPNTYYLK